MNIKCEKALEFARCVHGKDKSGHDFTHINRVYKMCLFLAVDFPEADSEVLQLAAALHDVDDYKLSGKESDKVGEFLRSINCDEVEIQQIKDIIGFASFSSNMGKSMQEMERSLPVEAKILSDSDKLDAMGAEGIIRTFNYGNKVGQPVFLHDCLPHKNLTQEEYRSDERKDAHSIAHFFDKLLRLRNMMFTDKAKVIAEQRHNFMLSFLREFFEEENASEDWLKLLTEKS